MTYVAPSTVVAGQTYGAAAHNVIVNDVIDLDTRVNNLIVPPACRVQKNATQNVTTAIDTLLTWNVESYDTDGMVDLGVSSSQITIQTTGIYHISAGVSFQQNGTNRRAMWVTKNGTSYFDAICGLNSPCQATASTVLGTHTIVSLTSGDIIRMYAYQDSGVTLTVPHLASAPETLFTFLSLQWVGRTS